MLACTAPCRVQAPMAGVQMLQMQLRQLVYGDDICLIAASLSGQMQTLIDALLSYCATMQMKISASTPKV